MIAIIDYGVGNLFSLSSSLSFLGLEHVITNEASVLQKADRILLPGVGAFKDASEKLFSSGLVDVIRQEVARNKPLLGICLGMQLLFDESLEYGTHKGLGLISGVIEPMRADITDKTLKVPHIGWNSLRITAQDELLKYTNDGDFVYYVHSYYAKKCAKNILAVSEYSVDITGIVKNKNVYGIQFHPEKSGEVGLNILKAFSEIAWTDTDRL